MDARQYLAQKGLDGKSDKRPQLTLEEKSWARARAAGEHRPHAGTPHDWEDWERYHEQLAEGAEQLEQKIDPEEQPVAESKVAENKVVENKVVEKKEAVSSQGLATQQASADQNGVQHYSPDTQARPSAADVGRPPLRPLAAYVALGVLLPPLAVVLSDGGARRAALSLLLTLFGWLPGVVHALHWILRARNSH